MTLYRHPIPAILEQHWQDASILGQSRGVNLVGANCRLDDLLERDRLLHGNLEALDAVSVEGEETAGSLFVTLYRAMKRGGDKAFLAAVLGVVAEPEGRDAAVGVLEWLDSVEANSIIDSLLNSKDAVRKKIGILAASGHRRTLGPMAEALVENPEHDVRACGIRWSGECGRMELLPSCKRSRRSSDAGCRFWAFWSCTLLGDSNASSDVIASFRDYPAEAELGILTAVRSARTGKIDATEQFPGRRTSCFVVGCEGNAEGVPVLFEQMANSEVARAAGEAFSMITGVDLAYEDLETDAPSDFETGPNDDPEDENVAMDPDGDLPWPEAQKVEKWWGENRHRFQPGVRYLCGRPINEETCWWVLEHGYQRQRAAAAMELALLKPGRPLFNVKAPAWRQLDLIRRRKTA